MFDGDILLLSRQGMTTGGIALHLGLSPQYVRQVVNADLTGAQMKSVYAETEPPPTPLPRLAKRAQHVAETTAARRAAAERKRDKALRQLAELNAVLDS